MIKITKKYVFKKSGILISGILGGLYSSTATTFILARKSKEANSNEYRYAAAIIFAIVMMYMRILIIMFIFNQELGYKLLPAFLTLTFISALTGIGILIFHKKTESTEVNKTTDDKNPLEFKVAIIFTILYIF